MTRIVFRIVAAVVRSKVRPPTVQRFSSTPVSFDKFKSSVVPTARLWVAIGAPAFASLVSLDREGTGAQQQYPSLADALQRIPMVATGICNTISENVRGSMESEGGRTILSITAINTAVYLLWKAAPAALMIRHFANSLEAIRKGRYWTSVTANFSHMSLFHLVANMYLLNRFGHEVADVLGAERFHLFYGTAGVASSLASLAYRRVTKSSSLSLGASGAVVATLWLYACFYPDRRMSLFGTEKSVTMQELVIAYTVIDAAGLLGAFGKVDFAAHLGGAVFANFWFAVLRDKLVEEFILRQEGKSGESFRQWLRGIFHNGDDRSNG